MPGTMITCEEMNSQIPFHFRAVDAALLKAAISTDDLSVFEEIPAAVRQHAEQCSDCLCRIDWYRQIRDEIDVTSYPCIDLAYAASSKANKIITRSHGMFALEVDRNTGTSIVIGFCPWCGKELNVSADGG